jgi:hypothetical protein
MKVAGFRRIGDRHAGGHNRVRGLGKIPRSLAVDLEAHLLRVIGIIAADAKDAMNGKAACLAGHWHNGHGLSREEEIFSRHRVGSL